MDELTNIRQQQTELKVELEGVRVVQDKILSTLAEMQKSQEDASQERRRIFFSVQQTTPPAYYQNRDFRASLFGLGTRSSQSNRQMESGSGYRHFGNERSG